jgi:hypothetical protein
MLNRIFRYTLLFILAYSPLSLAYAQGTTDQPCWQTIVSGKLHICLAYPENFQEMMMQPRDLIADYLSRLEMAPKVLMLKKLGLILDETQKAWATRDPKEYKKHVGNIKKNIRNICSQDDYHCSMPSLTSEEIVKSNRTQLLSGIESNTVDFIQFMRKEDDTKVIDARSGALIKNIRRNAELLALCDACGPGHL